MLFDKSHIISYRALMLLEY